MPTSPRASEIGFPTLRASSRARSSVRSRTSAATARIKPARSPGAIAFQAGKASRARATAASVSSAPARGSSASTSSVAGSMTLSIGRNGLPGTPLPSARSISHGDGWGNRDRHLRRAGAGALGVLGPDGAPGRGYLRGGGAGRGRPRAAAAGRWPAPRGAAGPCGRADGDRRGGPRPGALRRGPVRAHGEDLPRARRVRAGAHAGGAPARAAVPGDLPRDAAAQRGAGRDAQPAPRRRGRRAVPPPRDRHLRRHRARDRPEAGIARRGGAGRAGARGALPPPPDHRPAGRGPARLRPGPRRRGRGHRAGATGAVGAGRAVASGGGGAAGAVPRRSAVRRRSGAGAETAAGRAWTTSVTTAG